MSISHTVARFTLSRFSLQLHANIANGRRETAEANECKQHARPLRVSVSPFQKTAHFQWDRLAIVSDSNGLTLEQVSRGCSRKTHERGKRLKELIYFLPLSDNYSARGRPGRNAERGILPDLLSAILLCQAYKRNFTTRVMEGLTLNRFLHLHCERGIHYIRLGCSAGKKRRQFVMISSGRSSLPPASLMLVATRRSVMRTFRLDESVNLSSQSERISKSSMVRFGACLSYSVHFVQWESRCISQIWPRIFVQ